MNLFQVFKIKTTRVAISIGSDTRRLFPDLRLLPWTGQLGASFEVGFQISSHYIGTPHVLANSMVCSDCHDVPFYWHLNQVRAIGLRKRICQSSLRPS